MRIVVFGLGYVGLAMATLLSLDNEVVAIDINEDKISKINNRISPIKDELIEKHFKEKSLNLTAYLADELSYKDADFVIIATPTNYDCENDCFDTSSIENVIEKVIRNNTEAYFIIKSTVPVGYTASLRKRFNTDRIIFSPEFLRESKALYDNLYPSRIIVGVDVNNEDNIVAGTLFVNLLKNCALKKNIESVIMGRQTCKSSYDCRLKQISKNILR